jgi:aldose 1-epimerase
MRDVAQRATDGVRQPPLNSTVNAGNVWFRDPPGVQSSSRRSRGERSMSLAPSGEQFLIEFEDQHATIVEVGGGIREYAVGERPVLDPYPLDAMCDGAHGAVLIPWPNRLGDGMYEFDGETQRLALTEPAKSNAIHGLVRWRSWQVVEHHRSDVVMTTTVHPMTGYPFLLVVSVHYRLTADGLTVETTATNAGATACPYGAGQHPYLSPGSGLIDECSVKLVAGTRIVTDNERQLPTGTETVTGTEYDFSTDRVLGDQHIDAPFTDLARDSAGRAHLRLSAPDGYSAELWVDEHYPIIELYTGDTLNPDRRRRGLGAEPMTCPPDAFRTKKDLTRLEPSESMTTAWGARLV